jgi:S1-C subfamily serine protease
MTFASNSQPSEYQGNKCFQISVLINHGNSGGPLFDEMGQVVGITTFGEGTALVLRNGQGIGSDIQGINYAVKINEAHELLRKHISSFRDR